MIPESYCIFIFSLSQNLLSAVTWICSFVTEIIFWQWPIKERWCPTYFLLVRAGHAEYSGSQSSNQWTSPSALPYEEQQEEKSTTNNTTNVTTGALTAAVTSAMNLLPPDSYVHHAHFLDCCSVLSSLQDLMPLKFRGALHTTRHDITPTSPRKMAPIAHRFSTTLCCEKDLGVWE